MYIRDKCSSVRPSVVFFFPAVDRIGCFLLRGSFLHQETSIHTIIRILSRRSGKYDRVAIFWWKSQSLKSICEETNKSEGHGPTACMCYASRQSSLPSFSDPLIQQKPNRQQQHSRVIAIRSQHHFNPSNIHKKGHQFHQEPATTREGATTFPPNTSVKTLKAVKSSGSTVQLNDHLQYVCKFMTSSAVIVKSRPPPLSTKHSQSTGALSRRGVARPSFRLVPNPCLCNGTPCLTPTHPSIHPPTLPPTKIVRSTLRGYKTTFHLSPISPSAKTKVVHRFNSH